MTVAPVASLSQLGTLVLVDAADIGNLEQVVLNRVRSVLGLGENHLRRSGLVNGRGVGNLVNPRNAKVRPAIKELPYCR